MPHTIPTRGRDLWPTERPDAILEDTPDAARCYLASTESEACDVLELRAAQIAALLAGELVAYTTPSGTATLLLAYSTADDPPGGSRAKTRPTLHDW